MSTESASWLDCLGKDRCGSRPRCVLLVDGDKAAVAGRLTGLVGLPRCDCLLQR